MSHLMTLDGKHLVEAVPQLVQQQLILDLVQLDLL
jgi:hypothetical protein